MSDMTGMTAVSKLHWAAYRSIDRDSTLVPAVTLPLWLEAYLKTFPLHDDAEIVLIGRRILMHISYSEWLEETSEQHVNLVAMAERAIASWVRYAVGVDAPDDHLLVLRLKVALSPLKASWHRFDGLLSNQPSSEFVADLRSAMPEVTPPEQPAAMPASEYRCWQVAEAFAQCCQCLRITWRWLGQAAWNVRSAIASNSEQVPRCGDTVPIFRLLKGGVDAASGVEALPSTTSYGRSKKGRRSDSMTDSCVKSGPQKGAPSQHVAA